VHLPDGCLLHGCRSEAAHTVYVMATMAAGRRSRRLAFAPLRLLAAVIRSSTFVIAGIPVQLAGVAALALPWTLPVFVPIALWQVAVACCASACFVLLIRAPLTYIHRHRCWSVLGVEIPRVPAADGSLLARSVASLRSDATWRQLCYHLVVAPIMALCGLATLAAWVAGIGFAAIFAYSSLFPPLSQIQATPPKLKAALTLVGVLLLLVAAPLAAVASSWLDRRAATALLGPSRSVELERRVESLSVSRAGVVDAADAERRRIERDLHDGAQQRLVSLAMNLGMARESLTDLPEPARQMLADAHEEAKAALTELRNLVRGLHPAVLDDRGLDAALSGIAARAPLPVRLSVAVAERASPTVEAVAYFVVSECLANIAKHSAAEHAEIDVRRSGDTLRLVVTDDGVGGADPARGSGLASLAQRTKSVDGRMQIESPAGGPTVITVELPCGS
jgi:signal transduction histidine kinase